MRTNPAPRGQALPADAPTAFDFLSEPANESVGEPADTAQWSADPYAFKPLSVERYKISPSNPEKKHPIWFFNRGGQSDGNFVAQRMRIVPPQYKHCVSEHYEQIFLQNGSDGRRLANTWLDAVARKLGGRA